MNNPALYAQMLDEWSMRGMKRGARNGHDHFFDTFSRFGPAIDGHMGELLAELRTRAADGHLQYLELMTAPDDHRAIALGSKVGWDPNLATLRQKLLDAGLNELVREARHDLDAWHARADEIMDCGDTTRLDGRTGAE